MKPPFRALESTRSGPAYGTLVALTLPERAITLDPMKGWSISRWQVLVLASLLVAILLIVIIPDEWDLPDTAFQGGTAPLVIHSRTTSVPVLLAIGVAVRTSTTPESHQPFGDSSLLSAQSASLSVLISLRC
ncbi:MAG: hypothetical protein WBX03_09455 [Terriglobales bacterium]|jgi:hypothetical protein